SDSTIDETAPDAQMMKIQLETCAASRPNPPTAAIWTGTMPTAYQMKVVTPAAMAAVFASRRNGPPRAIASVLGDGRLIHKTFALSSGGRCQPAVSHARASESGPCELEPSSRIIGCVRKELSLSHGIGPYIGQMTDTAQARPYESG